MDKCLQTALISKVFVLQGRGCAQIAGNFKGFLKLINFLFFELFEIEKIGFEWLCVFIEPSGRWIKSCGVGLKSYVYLPLLLNLSCPSKLTQDHIYGALGAPLRA